MALTFAKVSDAVGVQGTIRETFYDVTFDASYPTGGEAIAPNEVGLGTIIHGAEVIGQRLTSGAPTTSYVLSWDFIAKKLQVFTTAGSGAIAAHTHDISIIGGQAAAGTAAVSAPAATDLLGKEEAGNALVLGADVATKGGIVAASAGSVAAAALAEVANTTNLATLIVRVRFVGV